MTTNDNSVDVAVAGTEVAAVSTDALDSALSDALNLKPLVTPFGSFSKFLMELKNQRERVCTSAAVIMRALVEAGIEDPKEEKDPARRQYLEMLKENGIPSFKAFYHAAGTQRFAMSVLSFLKSAAANGQQLKQMLIIEGGAGSGKDFFTDGIMRALALSGRVFAIEGCEHHENPLNVLKLLSSEQLKQVGQVIGIPIQELEDLLAVAGKPCQHCFDKVFGHIHKPNGNPTLNALKVEEIRLEPRSAGLCSWQPGADYTLAAALKQANRGFLSLPDAFIERAPRLGETDERLLLLDATQERRVPGGNGSDVVSAPAPLDCVIVATTNPVAYSDFLMTLPDQNAFTSRSVKLVMPYNTVPVEEQRAYHAVLALATERAPFDPLVVPMLATVAVLSRMAVPPRGDFIHPIDKMRRYNGEYVDVKLLPQSRFEEFWFNATPPSSDMVGDALEKDEPITAAALWKNAGATEGVNGLDMRFMLGVVSSINRVAAEAMSKAKEMQAKKKVSKDKDKGQIKDRVITLEVMPLIKTLVLRQLYDSSLTGEQAEVAERVYQWLGGRRPWGTDKPQLFEREYRRQLKQLILQVFSPDYERRAEDYFCEYKLHAPALFQGEATVSDPRQGAVVNVRRGIVDEIDRIMAGKSAGATLTKEDHHFGGNLEIHLMDAREKYIDEHPTDPDAHKKFVETWRTVPEIKAAIASMLDGEVGVKVEKILSTEIVTELSKEDQELFEKAKLALVEAGYAESVQKPVLEYAKRVKVWAHKD
jgi:predicted Ser/Thr protein kinase